MTASGISWKAGEDYFTDSSVANPEVNRIMDKVFMEKDETMPPNQPLVVLKTRDGRTMRKHVDVSQAIKSQENKAEALRKKFHECAGVVLSSDLVEELYKKVMNLEEARDVKDIIGLCTVPA